MVPLQVRGDLPAEAQRVAFRCGDVVREARRPGVHLRTTDRLDPAVELPMPRESWRFRGREGELV
ncbi:hypothetical protein RHRU231_230023 [Rhodococcus ruber]|uniref:Uncharacterized protein n=1 Tax=Rhodococcus ruber TaxID=1830 RepID=A0A098BG46_9NOCA|nr:hypothetical protein RHRU231_230023 [Rhodococcus ruber]